MASNFYQLTSRAKPDRSVVPGLIIMAVAVLVGLMVFALNSDIGESFPYFFMLPLAFRARGRAANPDRDPPTTEKFTIADPLMFATWGYFSRRSSSAARSSPPAGRNLLPRSYKTPR